MKWKYPSPLVFITLLPLCRVYMCVAFFVSPAFFITALRYLHQNTTTTTDQPTSSLDHLSFFTTTYTYAPRS